LKRRNGHVYDRGIQGAALGRVEYDREIEIARRAYLKIRASGKDRPLAYEKPVPESQAGGYIVYDKGALILNLFCDFADERLLEVRIPLPQRLLAPCVKQVSINAPLS